MNLSKDKTRVLLITHYITRAVGSEETDQRTLNYLLDKVEKIVYIAHPFPHSPFNQTIVEVYENGNLIKTEEIPIFKGPQILQYIIHILLNLWIVIKMHTIFDLSIALENLSFISLYPFRVLGVIKRIVYYSVDFVPQRFPDKTMNNIYHCIDRFSSSHSDINWVMVEEQITGRKNRDLGKAKYSPFALAPIGYNCELIKIKTAAQIDFYNIIFAGALLENSGPHLGIMALPSLLNKFPKIHYTIVGKGVFEGELKRLVSQLKLEKYVTFTGYIKSFKDLTKVLANASIGLAPFLPDPNSLSYYSDPSKIKLYLVSGLPVITTNVTTIAPVIKKSRAGLVINYDEKSLFEAVSFLLSDKKRYVLYKKAAISLSENYDIDKILRKAIERIPD